MAIVNLVGIIPDKNDPAYFQKGIDYSPHIVGVSEKKAEEAINEVAQSVGRQGQYFAIEAEVRDVKLTAT